MSSRTTAEQMSLIQKTYEGFIGLTEQSTKFSFCLALSSLALFSDLTLAITGKGNLAALRLDDFGTSLNIGYIILFIIGYSIFMSCFVSVTKVIFDWFAISIFMIFKIPLILHDRPSKYSYVNEDELLDYAQKTQDSIAFQILEKEKETHENEHANMQKASYLSFSCLILIFLHLIIPEQQSSLKIAFWNSFSLADEQHSNISIIISQLFLLGSLALTAPWIFSLFYSQRTLWIKYPAAAKSNEKSNIEL